MTRASALTRVTATLLFLGGALVNAPPAWPVVSGTWSAISGSGPSARHGHSAIYDSQNKRMIIFGGESDASDSLSDVWALSLDCGGTPIWTQLSPSGTRPTARSEHSAIYDAAHNRMIVHGGEIPAMHGTIEIDSLLSDTWELTLGASPAWNKLTPSGTACPRSGHTAIYNPNTANMEMFGGALRLGISTLESQGFGTLTLGASPGWTYSACIEHNCQATGGLGGLCSDGRPSPRQYHSAVYDTYNNRTIYFGGWYDDIGFSDVYTYNGSWSHPTPSGGPGTRQFHTAVWDSQRNRMLTFGGDDGGGTNYDDVYQLSADSTLWSQLSPAGSAPGARTEAAGVYDPVGDRLVVFGGRNGSGNLGSTHQLQFGDITAPGDVSSLMIAAIHTGAGGNWVRLQWTAPGDDGNTGQATRYIIKKNAGAAIDASNWASATLLTDTMVPKTAGSTDTLHVSGLSSGTFWYFALKTEDEACNSSGVSNNDCIKFGSPMQLCDGGGMTFRTDPTPALTLSLDELAPNPSRGSLDVSFTLPSSRTATLEMIDVAGRVVWRRDVGVSGAGRHQVHVGDAHPLTAGYYFVRLRDGANVIARPIVVRR